MLCEIFDLIFNLTCWSRSVFDRSKRTYSYPKNYLPKSTSHWLVNWLASKTTFNNFLINQNIWYQAQTYRSSARCSHLTLALIFCEDLMATNDFKQCNTTFNSNRWILGDANYFIHYYRFFQIMIFFMCFLIYFIIFESGMN